MGPTLQVRTPGSERTRGLPTVTTLLLSRGVRCMAQVCRMTLATAAIVGVSAGALKQGPPAAAAASELQVGDR